MVVYIWGKLYLFVSFLYDTNPEAESQVNCYVHALSLSCNSTLLARNSFGVLSQGYIVNEKPLKLEKTTASVLSVLLVILCSKESLILNKTVKGNVVDFLVTLHIKEWHVQFTTVLHNLFYSDKCFKGSIVNRACNFFNEGHLKKCLQSL